MLGLLLDLKTLSYTYFTYLDGIYDNLLRDIFCKGVKNYRSYIWKAQKSTGIDQLMFAGGDQPLCCCCCLFFKLFWQPRNTEGLMSVCFDLCLFWVFRKGNLFAVQFQDLLSVNEYVAQMQPSLTARQASLMVHHHVQRLWNWLLCCAFAIICRYFACTILRGINLLQFVWRLCLLIVQSDGD